MNANFDEIEHAFNQLDTPPLRENTPLMSTSSTFKPSYGVLDPNHFSSDAPVKSGVSVKKSVRIQGYDDKQKVNQLTTFCKSSTFVNDVFSFLTPISYAEYLGSFVSSTRSSHRSLDTLNSAMSCNNSTGSNLEKSMSSSSQEENSWELQNANQKNSEERSRKLDYIKYFLHAIQKFRFVCTAWNQHLQQNDDLFREITLLYSDYLLAYPLPTDSTVLKKDASKQVNIYSVIPSLSKLPQKSFHKCFTKMKQEHFQFENQRNQLLLFQSKVNRITYAIFACATLATYLLLFLFCFLLILRDELQLNNEYVPLVVSPLFIICVMCAMIVIPSVSYRLLINSYQKTFILGVIILSYSNLGLLALGLFSICFKLSIAPLLITPLFTQQNLHWSIFLSPLYGMIVFNFLGFLVILLPHLSGFISKFICFVSNFLLHLATATVITLISLFLELKESQNTVSFAIIFVPLYIVELSAAVALFARTIHFCTQHKKLVTVEVLVPYVLLIYVPLSFVFHHMVYTLQYSQVLPIEYSPYAHLVNLFPVTVCVLAFLSNFKRT